MEDLDDPPLVDLFVEMDDQVPESGHLGERRGQVRGQEAPFGH
jgi:hypothetical protein